MTHNGTDRPEGPLAGPGLNRRRALGGAAALGVGAPLLAACSSDDATEVASDAASDVASDAASAAGEAAGALAATADIPVGSGAVFDDQKVVVTQPTEGDFKAFSAICTHQGCPVSDVTDTINCTCHGSKFSISDGSVVDGPAPSPLPEASISIEGDGITLG